MKTCTACLKSKPLSSFHKCKPRKDGYHYTCKQCRSLKRNFENSQRPEHKVSSDLKYRYGITLRQYESLLASQNYCCTICKVHSSEFSKRLHVDHCHLTNGIRGLLCSNCNIALGLLKDSPELLIQAYKYLTLSPETSCALATAK